MDRRLILSIILLYYCEYVIGLSLKKVLIFGRHSLRAPLADGLARFSPTLPEWSVQSGELTPKGRSLERYMGEYISAWFRKEGLLDDRCPGDSVLFRTNFINRTIESGKLFSEAAFPDCHIGVEFKNITLPDQDLVFPLRVYNDTESFSQEGTREIQENLNKCNLTEAYEVLNKISDIGNSEQCKNEGFCDFTKEEDKVVFDYGKEPGVYGRMRTASEIADAFLMSFYEGFSPDTAWGKIRSRDLWKPLTDILNEELKVVFHLSVMRDYMKPLLRYMKSLIEGEKLFSMLVGHDTNLSPLMYTMGFESYKLQEQLEDIPIASMLVFQKWTDGLNDFLKVEFVYPTCEQIINAEKLTLSQPPKNVTMRFKSYVADDNGMYLWNDFDKILNDLVQ